MWAYDGTYQKSIEPMSWRVLHWHNLQSGTGDPVLVSRLSLSGMADWRFTLGRPSAVPISDWLLPLGLSLVSEGGESLHPSYQ